MFLQLFLQCLAVSVLVNCISINCACLRMYLLENEFNFWKVKPDGLHVNFARDPKYSWFHEHPKIEFVAYINILY